MDDLVLELREQRLDVILTDVSVRTPEHDVIDNHLVGKVTVQKLVPDNNQLSIATVDSLINSADTVREGDAVKN